jgi:hypothetical protein
VVEAEGEGKGEGAGQFRVESYGNVDVIKCASGSPSMK